MLVCGYVTEGRKGPPGVKVGWEGGWSSPPLLNSSRPLKHVARRCQDAPALSRTLQKTGGSPFHAEDINYR